MDKILIAVDDTKASKAVLWTFCNLVKQPKDVILLHVERLQGRSLIIDMMGDAEMSTLKDTLKGTEYKDSLDKRAEKILNYYKAELENNGALNVRTVIRAGQPAEEIMKVASEEKAELILLGYSGRKGLSRLIAGSVAADLQKIANVPVLTARRPLVCEEPYSWRDAFAAVSVTTAIVLGLFLFGIILRGGNALH